MPLKNGIHDQGDQPSSFSPSKAIAYHSRSYGKAEEFLHSWLAKREIAGDKITIGSKWGYTYTADWKIHVPKGKKHEVKDHSLPVLQEL